MPKSFTGSLLLIATSDFYRAAFYLINKKEKTAPEKKAARSFLIYLVSVVLFSVIIVFAGVRLFPDGFFDFSVTKVTGYVDHDRIQGYAHIDRLIRMKEYTFEELDLDKGALQHHDNLVFIFDGDDQLREVIPEKTLKEKNGKLIVRFFFTISICLVAFLLIAKCVILRSFNKWYKEVWKHLPETSKDELLLGSHVS